MHPYLSDRWVSLKHRAYSSWFRNPQSERLFKASKTQLDEVQQKVLRELCENGVALVHFDELFGDRQLWTILSRAADEFVSGPQVRDGLESWAKDGRKSVKKKRYLVRLYPENPLVEPDDLWLGLGVDARIVGVVNSYLGLFAKLSGFEVWYTIADTQERRPIGSQNWHRDPEDRKMVKVFLYCSDVTEGCGPLEYVRQSRDGERNCHTSYNGTAWRGSGEDIVHVASEDIVTATGRKGTLAFCDTAGLHRGGYAVDAPRVLAKWIFSTPASLHPRRFKMVDKKLAFDSAAARFAITCP